MGILCCFLVCIGGCASSDCIPCTPEEWSINSVEEIEMSKEYIVNMASVVFCITEFFKKIQVFLALNIFMFLNMLKINSYA